MSETKQTNSNDSQNSSENIIQEITDYIENIIPEKVDEFVESSNSTFIIDLESLDNYNSSFVRDVVVKKPDKFLDLFEQQLELAHEEYDGKSAQDQDVTVRVRNPPERYITQIREVRTDDRNNFLFIQGTVSKSTDVQPKVGVALYKCPDCGSLFERKVPNEDLPAPPIVLDCVNSDNDNHSSGTKKMDLVLEESRLEDFQRLRIQESPDEVGGDDPKNIDANLTGDEIAGQVHAGQKVTVSGVLRVTQPDEDSAILDRHIEGINVETEESTNDDFKISEDDENQIKELSEDPQIYQKLGQSIDPKLHGYDVERIGLALVLFSGVAKKFQNSGDIRGNIHLLLVGDPGTGKSGLLRYASELSPHGGVFTSGKGVSSAGLTAAAVRDQEFGGNDKWTLKAGALVMADEGVACVDELDKMSDTDRNSLHEALEQQEISISKAGITATLNARCSLIAAANPKHGRFDPYEIISEQIELDPALYSRFDLIFTIQDEIKEDRDRNISESILENNLVGQRNAKIEKELEQKYEGEDQDLREAELEEQKNDVHVPIPKDLFKKYIAYAQENYTPELTEDAKNLIQEKYIEIRQRGSDEDSPTPETARALEALVRLSEASARIKLSNMIEREHAEKAIEIYTESKEQTGTDPETGEWDAGITESGTTKSQEDRIQLIKDMIETFEDEDDELGAPREKVVEALKDSSPMGESKIESQIDKMLSEGREVYEPDTGRISLV